MSETISTTVYNWLREMKIPVSKSYIKQQLLSHPDYPSLLSISDTLTELRIENAAVQIQKDQLHEVDTPFLAHLNGNGGEFVVIKNSDYFDQQFPGFYKRWGSVVIAAEKPLNWIHKENDDLVKNDSKSVRAFLFGLSLLTLFIFFSNIVSFEWVKIGLTLIAVTGILVSWMIVSKDLGIENKIAKQVCGKDADCNDVIQSSVAKLPFNIGWSDAGIIYFPFLLIILLISSFNNTIDHIYPILGVFAVAAIPFTLVSIYHQWKGIKKWCRLCLITVTLLWLQFIILLPVILSLAKEGFGKTIITDAALTAFLLFITAAAWLWLKPLIKENKKLETENFAAKRFNRNRDVFNALLEKQRELSVNPKGLGITIGNPTATNTIIKICNPYCGPCAKAHTLIDKLLKENSNLKVQILFTADDDEQNIRAKPVKHLLALYEKGDDQITEKALDDWYITDKKDYDLFAKKYELNGELERQGEKLRKMKAWCDEMKIEFTPTFFVNGFELPKQYNVAELKYLLEK